MEETPSDARSMTTTALESDLAGPRRVTSLVSRDRALASPGAQLRLLGSLDLASAAGRPASFEADVRAAGHASGLRAGAVEIFQINIGKLCNMTCAHCHVDAGPDRTAESMDRETIDDCLRAIDSSGAKTVDITGGAPELNPHFRYLVDQCAARGRHVIDRCNLTVLLLPRCADLPEWLGERGVEIACSLPHHRRPNTDAQRGEGTWEKSIEALGLLNRAGYGQGDPRRVLTLVSNPAGAFLAGDQQALEREWKASLASQHGITFDRLIVLNNMPISRFLDWLEGSGNLQPYMERLVGAFNGATLDGLMCRNTISVSWDGRLFDCDFNQMLEIESELGDRRPHVRDFDARRLTGRHIRTGRHCYGCTAGAGSSCGGALAPDVPARGAPQGQATGATPARS
jgi:radical SAM/Cys-rich protein